MSRPPLLFRPSDLPPDPDPTPPGAALTAAAVPDGGAPNVARIEAFSAEGELLSAFEPEVSTFEPENEIRYKTQQRRPASSGPGIWLILLVAGIVGAILGLTFLAVRRTPATASRPTSVPAAQAMGQAQFDSRPSGADVVIDGVVRGKTPLKLSLPAGSHSLEITSDAGSRSLPLNIEQGAQVSQYIELLAPPDRSMGRLEITSEPAGAQVRVDGVVKGVTPLSIDDVEAREHAVSLTSGASTINRTVKVAPGASASVFVSMSAAAPGTVGGFLSLRTPFEVQVFEGGRLLGTTSTERLMLPTGRHALELVAAAYEFKTSLTVTIEPGRVASPAIEIPQGTLSINALPWAEVFMDGRGIGTTPLANLKVPVGNHEVVWRHPDLGERRQSVTVTVQKPTRVGVNFAQ
jgi:hypothetical protein